MENCAVSWLLKLENHQAEQLQMMHNASAEDGFSSLPIRLLQNEQVHRRALV